LISDLLHQRPSAVGRVVVTNDDFVVYALKYGAKFTDEAAYVARLVIRGCDDAELHKPKISLLAVAFVGATSRDFRSRFRHDTGDEATLWEVSVSRWLLECNARGYGEPDPDSGRSSAHPF
jgi:hypothetical protein